MAVAVTLTTSELMHGALCGSMRHVQNLKTGRRDKYGCKAEEGWEIHIDGALGELAVAKFLGRYWDGIGALGNFAALDVKGVNVRATTDPSYSLILREHDADDRPFVLVIGCGRVWTLRGWILGREGKAAEYARDPNGRGAAYFVPQNRLWKIETLPSYLGDRVVRA